MIYIENASEHYLALYVVPFIASPFRDESKNQTVRAVTGGVDDQAGFSRKEAFYEKKNG
jgi:hypothetical protein